MDPVTVDLVFTLATSLSLLLASMLALRALPKNDAQILSDLEAWNRVGMQVRANLEPLVRPIPIRVEG
jgi:hypothetical protein